MALHHSPSIVTSGLVLCLDAANVKSYPGTGTTWFDISGNGNNGTIDASGFVYNPAGYFSMSTGGFTKSGTMSGLTSNCTCVFWIKTTDPQSLFWGTTNNVNSFLGAYRSGNKYYNGDCGTPSLSIDTVTKANIYDNLLDNVWHMVEFKNVNFSSANWSNFIFSKYSQYSFENGLVSYISIYNKTLSSEESLKNFNALRGRYGI